MRILSNIAIVCCLALATSCGNSNKETESNGNVSPDESNLMEEIAESEAEAGEGIEAGSPEKPPYEIKDDIIYSENMPVVVDFYATWCGPCKKYSPIFKEVASKYEGSAIFLSLDAEQYPGLSKTYGISAYPTTVFIMAGGGVLGKEVGLLDASKLEMFVNQLLASSDGAGMEL